MLWGQPLDWETAANFLLGGIPINEIFADPTRSTNYDTDDSGVADDLFFGAGLSAAMINNGGDSVVLCDPANDEFISETYNGDALADPHRALVEMPGFRPLRQGREPARISGPALRVIRSGALRTGLARLSMI